MPDGSYFLNDIGKRMDISPKYIEKEARSQLKEIYRILDSYRGSQDYNKEFEHKIAVLVDDGIATGATMMASAQWLSRYLNSKELIIAAPLAPRDILGELKNFADMVVVPFTPDSLIAIGRFYESFDQVTDDQVKKIMKKYGYNPS